MTLGVIGVATQNNYTQTLTATMPDGTTSKTAAGIAKLYKATGSNEDGGMTQKAVTDALGLKADASALAAKADKTYVDEQIAAIPTSSGTVNLSSDDKGKIVVIGQDGEITAGTVSEDDIINALVGSTGYTAASAVGLEIDFSNKTFTRTQEATNKTMGSDFDTYLMYGGRKRCMVNDNGEIYAFYGDQNYDETNTSYQIMVYQPRFYYQRIPISVSDNKVGKIVQKDSIVISYENQNGFKLHPLFVDPAGNELEYVLLGAYEGALYSTANSSTYTNVTNNVSFTDDKLISCSGVKPLTGSSGLNM